MTYKIHHGSNLDILPTLPDNSVDSIVTDPPYELGFMGKAWDSTGIAYNVEMWKECLRVLKPGGHLVAFSGSRTYHRMAVAIEDAGFQIRDQIMWVYGSGFPKSHNIGKAVDSDWEGWGTALKPAHEPIVLARKPIDGTIADNVLKWGVGGLNIDGCRVEYQGESDKEQAHHNALGMERLKINEGDKLGSFEGGWKKHKPTLPKGRFPANFMHDGSQQILDLFPHTKSGMMKAGQKRNSKPLFDSENDEINETYGDSGSAARFFYCPKANKKDRNEGCEDFDERRESDRPSDDKVGGDNLRNRSNTPRKNSHPTVKPNELMRYLCRLITPPNGTVLDPFNGSGSTGKASVLEGFNYIGIELDPEYIKISEARINAALTLKK
jgi:site-specific DNA-methyltransferase (adenine-specific)